MAKQYYDVGISTEKGSMTKASGTSLTLGSGSIIRVLYEDTIETGNLITTLKRVKEVILERGV